MISVSTRGSHVIRLLALSVAAVYFALGLLVAACPVDAPSAAGAHEHGATHHHGAHAWLCAWACQTNASAQVPAAQGDGRPSLLFLGLVVAASVPVLLVSRKLILSRGPPLLPVL